MQNKIYQYQIMTEDQKNESGSYIPNYEQLIKEAPNEEIANEWANCQERFAKREGKWAGFAFNCVYIIKMKCGHYEILQHYVHSKEEIENWIENVDYSKKHYRNCTMCICG